jgi:hypothetical protein
LNRKKLILPLLAFFIPLLVRLIPEVIMGPYLVGFDVMAHYVPTTLLWLNGNVTLWSFVATAPLLYVVTAGFTLISGSVFIVLKILPSVLLGFLGLAIYTYARRGLAWSPKKSLIPALVGTLYFVALRISWDALREEIAIIFLFLVLTAIAQIAAGKSSKKNYVLLALSLGAVVLSNQVVAVLAMGIALFTVIYMFLRQGRLNALRTLVFSLPAAVLFLAIFYLSPSIPEYRIIFGFPSSPDGWLSIFGYASYPEMLASEAVFIVYCFVLLLPLALLSIRRFQNFQMRSWIVLIAIVAFIPLVSPSGLRLLMLLTYPLAFYATDALSLLKSVRWKRFAKPLVGAGMVYLVVVTAVFSLGFMVMPGEAAFPYFGAMNTHIYQIPSSMLQNTVSINDCPGVADAVQWLKSNMTDNSVLISHRAFYGWALSGLDKDQVILYEYDNPGDTAVRVANDYSKVYLIWWVDGQGWYGLPSVPSVFNEVYRSGNIAVYVYSLD